MKGMFVSGDILEIEPYKLQNLLLGDIVIFKKFKKESAYDLIVHRVFKINGSYLITKGDSNKRADVSPVTNSNLIGKVDKFERKGKSHKVRGGLTGLYLSRSKYYFRRILILIYMNLIKLKIVRIPGRFILNFFFRDIIRINFSSPGGTITKWVLNRKVIARMGPEKGDFYCQKPFGLIIENQK